MNHIYEKINSWVIYAKLLSIKVDLSHYKVTNQKIAHFSSTKGYIAIQINCRGDVEVEFLLDNYYNNGKISFNSDTDFLPFYFELIEKYLHTLAVI